MEGSAAAGATAALRRGLTLQLSETDMARIDAAFPLGKAPRGLPMI